MGEFLQISLGMECLSGLYLPQFDEDLSKYGKRSEKKYYWNVYPKGIRKNREPYEIGEICNALMYDWIGLHKRYLGYPISKIPPSKSLTHEYKLNGKYNFVLQWNKRHLNQNDITGCLAFILLNHGCTCIDGQAAYITSHDIRHIESTEQYQNGKSLIEIMRGNHQNNPKTTDYYSKPSCEEIIKTVKTILDNMSYETQIDPACLRNPDDITKPMLDCLSKVGALRQIPGGKCASFCMCKMFFSCARCINFIPGINQQAVSQILSIISALEHGVEIFSNGGEILKARQEKEHIKEWKLVLAEIESWQSTLELPPSDDFPLLDSNE